MNFREAFDPIRALKSSWTALFKAPLPLFIGGIILLITEGGNSPVGYGMQFRDRHQFHAMMPFLGVMIAFSCCLGLVFFLVSSWVSIGFANSVEQTLRTGDSDVGVVFETKGRFGEMILARILQALVGIAAALPLVVIVVAAALLNDRGILGDTPAAVLGIAGALVYLPVLFYVVLGLALVMPAVALDGLSPFEALKRSWTLVGGNRWQLVLYVIVLAITHVLGICLCCVGVFLTGTLGQIAWNESYLALTRGAERSTWWIASGKAHEAPIESWGAQPPHAPPPPPSVPSAIPPAPPPPPIA